MLDVAKRLLVIVIEGGMEADRHEEAIDTTDLVHRAHRIVHTGVDVLICGAISRPLEMMLTAQGVKVIPHTCGSVEDVLRAFQTGQFTAQSFLMPGCCGRLRRVRRGPLGDEAGPPDGGGPRQQTGLR